MAAEEAMSFWEFKDLVGLYDGVIHDPNTTYHDQVAASRQRDDLRDAYPDHNANLIIERHEATLRRIGRFGMRISNN